MVMNYLIPGLLAGSVRPGKDGSVEDDIRDIRDAGFAAVISLYDEKKSKEADFASMELDGLSHYSFRFPDFDVPDRETADAIVATIHRHIERNEPVLVHCGAGIGRTGTALALYAKRNLDTRGKSAVEYVRDVYLNSAVETEEQEEFVESY